MDDITSKQRRDHEAVESLIALHRSARSERDFEADPTARLHARETERLKERLGAVTMLLGCAKSALKGGRVMDAVEWINQAEQAATRGGD
jgi:hypothetical protein